MMDTLVHVAITVLSIYLGIQVFILMSAIFAPKHQRKALIGAPKISILIAARNEALNILDCLQSIHNLRYPKDSMQVLIGDDQSEDDTAQLVKNYITDKPYMHLHRIEKTIGKAKGKANVLAQLAHQATGEFLFVTDADIEVNVNWIEALLSHQQGENAAMVSGVTVVKEKDLFSSMQRIDWLYFMGILYALHRMGFEATAVGNNMMVSQKAYNETGGYENIDFSITEDYKLYKEIKKRNHRAINILSKDSINESRALESIQVLMHQRKRWLTGAKELPFYWWMVFAVFGLFLPASIMLLLYDWQLAVQFFAAKFILQWLIITVIAIKSGVRIHYLHSIFYECYTHVISLLTSINFFIPTSIRWKNRNYTL